MAQKPDGKGAKTERVTFTRPAAERIAKVVRKVEAGNRDSKGLRFERVGGGTPPASLKVATFTGSWNRGTFKTVTIVGGTATASVYNWCNDATGDTASTTSTRYVVFGKANGTQSAVEIQLKDTNQTCVMTLAGVNLTALPGYSAGVVQLLGHSAADVTTNNTACASLTWYSVTTCATATAA